MIVDIAEMYPSLGALLFVVTGALLLGAEHHRCQRERMHREARWCRRLGWVNILSGAALWITVWVVRLVA
ncbi:CLC_0170 family protein [Alicyclobacillus sp.]|uniref:CLC_0170 family protein n=1 Tax=Alicyclobacillus sp. TaxID=61169 RepID=UPI0025BAD0E6|nr:CLC_0170 family protein [Alicyclobacillus sp.]MCL6516427.1 hypothetical protein [Alicyclobacillus sp.]